MQLCGDRSQHRDAACAVTLWSYPEYWKLCSKPIPRFHAGIKLEKKKNELVGLDLR